MNRNFTVTLLLCVFFSRPLFAQNFKTIYPGTINHFSYTAYGFPVKTFFNTISIDSSVNVAGGDELYNFVSLEKDSFNSCLYANRSTWIAAKIFQDASGAEFFLNASGDTIFIFPQAAVTSSWHLYNYGNGNYIEATVMNAGAQNFSGITDNVKTIQLNAKNSSGNNIAHILNGKEIKLSEHYGFVQTLSYKNFPGDTTAFVLAGLSNPQAGIINLTADSIFNFNVGDEFHYHNEFHASVAMWDVHYAIKKILSKSFSANSDTVYYQADVCWRHEHLDAPNYYLASGQDTVSEGYDISASSVLNQFSFQVKDTSAGGFAIIDNGFLNFYSDTSYLSRLKKVTHHYYTYDTFQQCFTPAIGFGIFPDRVYAPGLGSVYMIDQSCTFAASQCFDSLVYYKKGNEIWGQPLSCPALLSADEISFSSLIKIFPNPVTGGKITVTGNFEKPSVKLTDVLGKNLNAKFSTSGSKIEIDISKLSQGIYLLKIFNGKKFFTAKFVVP